MSTADKQLEHAHIHAYTVAAASTATYGLCGVFTAEHTVRDATAGENASVWFYETKTAGQRVECVLLNSNAVVPMKSSGTVTAGEYVEVGTDGVQNRTLGGGTTVRYIVGKALQTGVDNDFLGVAVIAFAGGSS
jgi:hypothetical protein